MPLSGSMTFSPPRQAHTGCLAEKVTDFAHSLQFILEKFSLQTANFFFGLSRPFFVLAQLLQALKMALPIESIPCQSCAGRAASQLQPHHAVSRRDRASR
jgi:hypothetical protein